MEGGVLEGQESCKPVRIRLARADDAPDIHALMQAAFRAFEPQYTPDCFDATVLDPERIAQRMTEGPVWVAESDGQLLGTVSAVPDARGVYLRGLAVHPEARRQRVGLHLLHVVEGYADGVGAPRVWLSTTTFLDASQELYRAAGFVNVDGPPDLHGTPLVSFEKVLIIE